MDTSPSFAELALAGVERMRRMDHDARGRAAALLLLLRGSYYTGETKWRAMAEEDLRALWRGGVHDHIGGGFFSASGDREWLRPRFEKRLDDNAALAFLFTEAWEKGRMSFHREAAEESLDFCLRALNTPSGLYAASVRAARTEAGENPFLFTPEQIREILGEDEGRHFAECYDVTDEGNCGEASIPNLILNQRWSLVPEGWDDLRERLRLAREARGGLLPDRRTPPAANAMLLAALAKAARVYGDRRYLAAAHALADRLAAAEAPWEKPSLAARLFALTELYAADFDPAHIAAASALADALGRIGGEEDGAAPSEQDRALSFAALGFETLWRLTGDAERRAQSAAVLMELALHPERHGPESLAALCAAFSLGKEVRRLLCLSPREEIPEELAALRSRYAPDLCVLLKTPLRASALAAAVPDTAAPEIGEKPLFSLCGKGFWGPPLAL